MSRIGKKPIPVPSGVEVAIDGRTVTLKGKAGSIVQALPEGIAVSREENSLQVTRSSDSKQQRAYHGLVRSLLDNHVTGVAEGYRKDLDIVGVSYQAALSGNKLTLKVGYANAIVLTVPQGITVEVPSTTQVVVKGADKQKVGHFAALVRGARPPEPYKGKGVRYRGEHIVRKQGKSFVGSE